MGFFFTDNPQNGEFGTAITTGLFAGISHREGFARSTSSGTTSASATIPDTLPLSGNTASYYGLNIPVSMGKRALTGVPIFAGAVRVDGGARFIDVAYAFGEPGAPDDELLDTQVTKIWINGELVEAKSEVDGWASSGSLNYVVYPGYEDQFPDPRIEKWLGANQTPAFRDLIYIMFYDLPLHQFSPSFSIPFVRAEFVDIIENVVQVEEFAVTAATGVDAPIFNDQVIIPNWERQHSYMFDTQADGSVVVVVIDLTTNSEISRNVIAESDGTAILDLAVDSSVNGAGVQEPSTGFIFTQRGVNNHRPVVVFDPYTGEVLGEFGDDSTATVDNLTGSAADRFRAPVSRSDTMLDRIICASTQVAEQVGFWRISSSGIPSLAYADDAILLGDDGGAPDFGGEVQDVTTGDKIRGTNIGFGTVIVSRETAIYRITIQAGTTGDGNPIDVDANSIPLHLPPTDNSFGGTTSQPYVDIVETKDPTNGTVAATAAALATGIPQFDFDLVDFGDLSAASFDTRASAFWIRFESTREFRQFFVNNRSLDNLHLTTTAGAVSFELAVSANGTSWTPISDFNITNTLSGVLLGTNAPAALLAATPQTVQMAGESIYGGAPFSPLPEGIYVGFAVEQKNYVDGSVVAFTPWAGGRDGLEVLNGEIQFPDLLEPHMINLWNPPVGYTIQMTFLEPKSEDLIVFFREDSSGDDYAARIEINEDIKGVPTPADPLGLGATELWVAQMLVNFANWDLLHHSFNYSDLTSQTLAYANNSTNEMNVINLATGHQRVQDFGTAWKVFGAGSNDPEPLDMQERQVWNGAANTMISQWNDATPVIGFSMAKIVPFVTDVTGYPLSDLLRWMSLRVGYTEAEIDTTSVTDTVIGAILLERIPFRDLMNNIGQVYDFDVFESEGQIKFKKALKGGSFVIDFALTAADVSSIEGGEGLDGGNDPYGTVSRNPADGIPTAVELKYLDINADYTVNSAFARRTRFPVNTTGHIEVEPVVFAVPIVMTAAEALLRSTRLLYRAWGDNAIVEYRVPTEYLTMEPADVVSIPIDGTTYQVKNIETIINVDHSVSVTGTTVSSDELDVSDAQNPLQLPQTVGGPSASNLFYLDIPPLTGADAAALAATGLTVYTAVVSKGQGSWVSASLYYNKQFPSFIKAYTNGIAPQASGQAISTLGAGAEGMITYGDGLTALLGDNDGTFATLTAAQILTGDNLCAYGKPGRWELMQVQTVTNSVGDVFDLTDIVRGLYGTEVFSAMHEAGDLFIVLNRPPVRPDAFANYVDLGSSLGLKAVGARQEELDISPQVERLSGAFERMLPVTNLKATTSGSDIVITWNRRTRLENVWVDSVEEVPEEDTSSTFELEILGNVRDTGFIRQVLDLDDPTYTYANADILTDFGVVPDTVFIRVFHNSTEVGRNLPETKELDVLP